MNPFKILQCFTTKTYNTVSADRQTQERYRAITWSIATNILSKATGMAVMFAGIKLTIPYLGAERFGVWVTIASFASILSFLDMGIGNALTNQVAYNSARTDKVKLQQTISSGIFALTIIGLIITVVLMTIAYVLPWHKIIKVNSTLLNEEIRFSCIFFSGIFGFQIISGGIQRVFAGLQKAYISNVISTIGYSLSLILLFSISQYHPSIPILIMITLGCTILAHLLSILILIKEKLFVLSKISKSFNSEYKILINNGGLFFILQIGTMVGWGADNLIISSTIGASYVAIFNVTQKMFQIVAQPIAILNAPLWSAYADAHTRADNFFIVRTFKISLVTNILISSIFGLLLLTWGSEISQYWTNNKIAIPSELILAFFIWTMLNSIGMAIGIFLNGCNIIKPQIYTVLVLIAVSIPAKIFTIQLYGLTEMVFCFIFLYSTIIIFMYGVLFREQILTKGMLQQPKTTSMNF